MVVLVTPIRVQVLCMTVLTARWRPVLERAPVSALPCRIPLYTPLSCHSLFFFLLLARSPGLVFFFLFPFLLFARSRCHLKFFYRREGRKWNKTKEKRGAGGRKEGKEKKIGALAANSSTTSTTTLLTPSRVILNFVNDQRRLSKRR